MPVQIAVALITASPALATALLNFFKEIVAAGHPPEANLTPAHVSQVNALIEHEKANQAMMAAAAARVPAPLADPDGPE